MSIFSMNWSTCANKIPFGVVNIVYWKFCNSGTYATDIQIVARKHMLCILLHTHRHHKSKIVLTFGSQNHHDEGMTEKKANEQKNSTSNIKITLVCRWHFQSTPIDGWRFFFDFVLSIHSNRFSERLFRKFDNHQEEFLLQKLLQNTTETMCIAKFTNQQGVKTDVT